MPVDQNDKRKEISQPVSVISSITSRSFSSSARIMQNSTWFAGPPLGQPNGFPIHSLTVFFPLLLVGARLGGGAGHGVPHGGGGGPATQRLFATDPLQTKFSPVPGEQCGHGVQTQHDDTFAGVPARWQGSLSVLQVAASSDFSR